MLPRIDSIIESSTGKVYYHLTLSSKVVSLSAALAVASGIFKSLISQTLLLSLSKCMGFMSISEDSSEISFLLVENYNYDHSLWSSDRMGIFG